MFEAEKLLCDLIALPSVNPAFLAPGDVRAGEQRVAHFLADIAERAGLDIELREVFQQRHNFLACLTSRKRPKQRILLAPHLDTVNGTDEQFTPRKKNGRLYGRGACDTKGSVAAMFGAVCDLSRTGRRPAETEIVFAGLVDEEDAQRGSRALAANRFPADLALVGEPTRLRVVTAHKGSLWLRLETRGRSAHGSRPELGRNAIHSMARIVSLFETEYAAQLKRRRHPVLGRATVSVGVIAGGTQANIVPDRCSISVDRRTLPGETEASVRREITALLRSHGLRAICDDGKQAPCLPLESDPKLPLIAQLLRQFHQSKPAGVDYFCDAAVLAQGGIPSVAFGPGDIAQAHTADEWISIAELERSRRMLVRYLRSLP